jgi:GT2 family glycosyltransferase
MSEKNKLTIIIVTYNSDAIINNCLTNISLEKNEVFVIDNNSSDKTLEIVANNFPAVKIIKNSKNIGFGRANNIGLLQTTNDFALILNVDAQITEEDIEKTIEIMLKNPDIAIAGGVVHNCIIDENNKIISSYPCQKNLEQLKEEKPQELYFNKFVTGAGMFLNMKIMRKIGFFDEGFFLYCEDNEICKRAIKKGFKTAIFNDTKLLHIGNSSSKITDAESTKIYWHKFGWSKLYYTQKVHGIIVAKLKAIRMILKFSIICLKEFILNRKISAIKSQGLKGSIAYFIGLGAFDKNNKPRG